MKTSARAFGLPRAVVKTPVDESAVDQFTSAEKAPALPRLVKSPESHPSTMVALDNPGMDPLPPPDHTPDATRLARSAAATEKGDARLIVSMPPEVHRSLKVRCAERGITIRAYMLSLLAADGLSGAAVAHD